MKDHDDEPLKAVPDSDAESADHAREQDWLQGQLDALTPPKMPQQVRARLDSAIAAEADRHRSQDESAEPSGSHALPQQRRRPILLSLLGTAAALVLFAAVDPFSASRPAPDDLALQAPQEESSSGATVAPPALDGQGPGSTAVFVASGTAYTREDLASQAAQVLAAAPSSAEQGAVADVAACVASVPGVPVLVDQATFEGRAAIVTVTDAAEGLIVTVQETTCTAADPAVVYRDTVDEPPTGE